jgi:hypothetical protein
MVVGGYRGFWFYLGKKKGEGLKNKKKERMGGSLRGLLEKID